MTLFCELTLQTLDIALSQILHEVFPSSTISHQADVAVVGNGGGILNALPFHNHIFTSATRRSELVWGAFHTV